LISSKKLMGHRIAAVVRGNVRGQVWCGRREVTRVRIRVSGGRGGTLSRRLEGVQR
jgi:hypothetical protein